MVYRCGNLINTPSLILLKNSWINKQMYDFWSIVDQKCAELPFSAECDKKNATSVHLHIAERLCDV